MTVGTSSRDSSRAVLKGLAAYLFLAWLLVQLAPQAARLQLVAWAVLLGFPVTVFLARLLHRHGLGVLAGGWAIAVLAGFAAISVPVICLQVPTADQTLSRVDSNIIEMIPASLVGNSELTGSNEQLKLRIRGLTVHKGISSAAAAQGAELILYASLRESDQNSELVIKAELVGTSNGAIIWSREYLTDPSDFSAIRRLLLRALTDGMSLTREGAEEGLIV